MNYKNLLIRTLTGAVYALLLIGSTVYSPIAAFFFFAIVAAATLAEFGTIMNRHAGASLPRPVNALAGVTLISAVWLSTIGSPQTARMFALYGLVILYMLVSELYRRSDNPLRNWTLCFASQLYVAVPFALLPLLSMSYDAASNTFCYNWIYPLALFIFIWVNDTFAYLCGCTLSRFFPAKLFPRISPKKSWAGSIGGGLFTLAAAVVIWRWQQPEEHAISQAENLAALYHWMGFALVVVLAGTWGDLTESLIKRQLGIKDSGNILPGHGGMLDRFDSALLAIPASVIYFILT